MNALKGNVCTPDAFFALYQWLSHEKEEDEFRMLCERKQITNEVWNHFNTLIDYCNEQMALLPNVTLPFLRLAHRTLYGQKAIAGPTNINEIMDITLSIRNCNNAIDIYKER